MIEIDISVPASDIQKMNETMDRYVNHFNGNAEKAITRASWAIARSLRASTKDKRDAPNKREVIKNPDYAYHGKTNKKGKLSKKEMGKRIDSFNTALRRKFHISEWYQATNPDKDNVNIDRPPSSARWAVVRWKKGRKINMPIIDSNDPKYAKKHPFRIMKKKGLADKSWFWMLGKLNASSKGPAPADVSAKGDVVSAVKNFGLVNKMITIWNKLPYIRNALNKGGGKTDVSSAVSRASKTLEWDMMDASQKAIVKAGLHK